MLGMTPFAAFRPAEFAARYFLKLKKACGPSV
jgi:hypothetical protein